MDHTHGITIDQSALARIETLRQGGGKHGFDDQTLLRVAVDGGGCSGFQYRIEAAQGANDDDIVFDNAVVIDQTSLPFLKNAVIRFQNDLMGAMFVVDNPNASSSCGCSTSFSIDPSKLF